MAIPHGISRAQLDTRSGARYMPTMARVKTSPLYNHACPRCGAPINTACTTANGKSKPGGHAQRRALAGMKPDKSGTSHAVRRARKVAS